MVNNAVNVNNNIVNDKHVAIAITAHGSDVYFAICAAMGVTTLAIIAASAMKPRTDRIFFYITAGVTGTATIAYFTMGSNLGWTPITVEFPRTESVVSGPNREIFYARYVDWSVTTSLLEPGLPGRVFGLSTDFRDRFITTPLLLLDLLLTAGMPWPTIIWTIFLDEVMIVTGLVGALVKTRYKWGTCNSTLERRPSLRVT